MEPDNNYTQPDNPERRQFMTQAAGAVAATAAATIGGSSSAAAAEKSGNTAFLAEMSKRPEDQRIKTHNRSHPDIPFVQWFKPGEEFRVECYDWTGGQIKNDNSASDVRDVNLTLVHYLSGPFGVQGGGRSMGDIHW